MASISCKEKYTLIVSPLYNNSASPNSGAVSMNPASTFSRVTVGSGNEVKVKRIIPTKLVSALTNHTIVHYCPC